MFVAIQPPFFLEFVLQIDCRLPNTCALHLCNNLLLSKVIFKGAPPLDLKLTIPLLCYVDESLNLLRSPAELCFGEVSYLVEIRFAPAEFFK